MSISQIRCEHQSHTSIDSPMKILPGTTCNARKQNKFNKNRRLTNKVIFAQCIIKK